MRSDVYPYLRVCIPYVCINLISVKVFLPTARGGALGSEHALTGERCGGGARVSWNLLSNDELRSLGLSLIHPFVLCGLRQLESLERHPRLHLDEVPEHREASPTTSTYSGS